MNVGRILFIAILLFSATAILATGAWAEKIIYSSMILDGSAAAMADLANQSQLEDAYRQNVLAIMEEYHNGNLGYGEIEKKLLAVKVPASYQELHFKLVSSFADLELQKKSDELKGRLEGLQTNYSWLSAAISFLIANNF